MSVTHNIVAAYKGPRPVMQGLLSGPENEGRNLAMLMGACAVLFIAQWPRLAREAHTQEVQLEPLLGGALLGLVFIAPLGFYLVASLSHFLLGVLGRPCAGHDARLALFWALLAASPLALLRGLIAGFVGPGAGLILVDIIWVAVFCWFWVSNVIAIKDAAT